MITINAKTKQVWNACEHEPQMNSEWLPEWNIRWNTTPGYIRGWTKPNYPVPAIRDDAMLHISYPRVLSEKDRTNADAYFWQMFHRRYGKR